MIEFYTIAIIGILGAIAPGPDFIVVAKNAIGHSRVAGCFTTFGIATGILIHSTYCILGLAVIISHSLLLFNIIRYLGALYLIYLGIKAILSKNTVPMHLQHQKMMLSSCQAFREGLLVNLLNPKCILFMLAIFTMVVMPNTPYWTQAIYSIELSSIAILWFCFVSFILTHHRVKQQIAKIQTIAMKLMGLFLIGFGLDLILIFISHK